MSGGVDSSVAALIMKEQGYEVIGVFLKCWSDTKTSQGECAWKDERRMAQRICNLLEIPLITVDAEKEYRNYVVDLMFEDYRRGVTPNPDVWCNESVKFPFLLKQAKKFKADYVVTGHFVQVKKSKGVYYLYRGLDESKDQSYFLYRLNGADLSKLQFPIGALTKSQVRAVAEKNGFVNYDKKSTVGICFIGKQNMKDFLKGRIKEKKGEISDPEGNIIGTHDGVYYYTIGQRLGPRFDLDIPKEKGSSFMKRWYVAKKDVAKNVLIVAPEGHPILYRDTMVLEQFHLISDSFKDFKRLACHGLKVHARIRHVGELEPATLTYLGRTWHLQLLRKITGISNGQAAVIYKGRRVLGGGVIS